MSFPCIRPSEILLPNSNVDLRKWAVIACDQYTSQPDYWERVRAFVGSAPSTLHLICPEAFLASGYDAVSIRKAMDAVLDNGTVTPFGIDGTASDGFVLTERTTKSGVRTGLVAALDLETYDYRPGSPLVRATEKTVEDRLPPRIRIRKEASLELPHILLLMDDPGKTVLEPLADAMKQSGRQPDYAFELMENGGFLRGWRIRSDERMAQLSDALHSLERRSGGLLFAVGDGNHSLAAAKAVWEERKKQGANPETDPFRYALAEIVNLHEDAIRFEPIHRLITGTDKEELENKFRLYAAEAGCPVRPGTEIRFAENGAVTECLSLQGRGSKLPVQILQPFLDRFLTEHPGCKIDYIHGEQALLSLTEKGKAVGILLEKIRKEDLFPGVRAGGCLPRKTFSMGEADEKRFYFECRRLT
ncbi:MAG: DUF1015 domain-containing protein [Clostridia bacterium]|nr:DUF1015 domain-containing protein [Clostridia bacterium]